VQAEAVAVLLGRESEPKHLRHVLRADAGTGVGDADADPVRARVGNTDGDADRSGLASVIACFALRSRLTRICSTLWRSAAIVRVLSTCRSIVTRCLA
jgi:hypothetical protein